MQSSAPASLETLETTVSGTFSSVHDAEQALHALRGIGIPSDRIVLNSEFEMHNMELLSTTTPDTEHPTTGRTNVAGGAATGATLGGLVGILWGWISGSSVATVPGAVATVSSGILTSSITGLAIGAAVGGLVGALVGVGMPAPGTTEELISRGEKRVVLTVLASGDSALRAQEILLKQGAQAVQPNAEFGVRNCP